MRVNRVLIQVRRHSGLLLCSFALSVAVTVINSHSAQALVGADAQGLVRNLQSGNVGNLLKQQKTDKPNNANEKADSSDSKASSAQVDSSASSSRPAGTSVNIPVQPLAGDLTPLPTIDTPISLYPYLNMPQGLLAKSKIMASAVAIDKPGSPVLAASSQGWKVAGLAWYWWLAALGLAALAGRWGLYQHKKLIQGKIVQ